MSALRGIFAELAGLFVEDRTFALAIAVWIALVGALAATHALAPASGGIVLFAGLTLILVASVLGLTRED
jgi:hypothetical protein